MATLTLHDRRLAGELAGWEQGLPPRRGLVDAATIDGAVARGHACGGCGASPCGYFPYRPVGGGGGYRAFAVCATCGQSEEI